MSRRAFGPAAEVISARELGGGTFNRTFLITLAHQPAILRIAPPLTAEVAWHEQQLMRREHLMQPFFAAVAYRMPRTLFTDFTGQVIERDYMFQAFLEGERWDDVADHLSPSESAILWEEFGRLTRSIHDTRGTSFGGPPPLPEFRTWSEALLYRLERALQAILAAQRETADLQTVIEIVRHNSEALDRFKQPHLLHGDLWLFNILIQRQPAGPQITGILDADRAGWGDPLADWTMFVLAKSASPETAPLHRQFWSGYGSIEELPGLEFRKAIYEALHIGTALAWAARHHDEQTLTRGRADLRALAARLPDL